jgi:DNA-binding CsgD family transcriptional regulator
MTDLIELVQQGSGKYKNKISNLIESLAVIYGIDAYAYYHLDSQGFMSYLSNFPDRAEIYFATQAYLDNPFLRHPSLLQSSFIVADGVDDPNFQRGQHSLEPTYYFGSYLLVLEKEGENIHAHCLCTSYKNRNLTNVYLNNRDQLLLFCRYFREETQVIQKKLNSVDYGKLVGELFFDNSTMRPLIQTDAKKKFFAWFNRLRNPLILAQPLSKRETDILEEVLKGKSASAVGKKLYISPRTVEHHIESIKNKLGCSTKADLFKYIDTLKAYGGEISFLISGW